MKPKVVIFDLDNTLYDEHEYLIEVIKYFENEHKVDMSNALLKLDKDIRQLSGDILKNILDLAEAYNSVNHDNLFLSYQNCEADINISIQFKLLLAELKVQGIYSAILTNGVLAVQKNKVRCLQLESMVDQVFYARSEGAKYEKPHVNAFLKVADAFNVKTQDCVMIGDNINNDIQGALNAGMQAILFGEYTKPKLTQYSSDEYCYAKNIKELASNLL